MRDMKLIYPDDLVINSADDSILINVYSPNKVMNYLRYDSVEQMIKDCILLYGNDYFEVKFHPNINIESQYASLDNKKINAYQYSIAFYNNIKDVQESLFNENKIETPRLMVDFFSPKFSQ